MDKKPLIGVSILAVVLLVLGSLSNVVGYQTVQTSQQNIIKERINQRELLFQTIVDIANNKEIQRIILKSQISRGIFPTSKIPVITKNQLKQMYVIGLLLSKIISKSRIQSMMGKYQFNNQETQKEISAVIEPDIKIKAEISQLQTSECDCENEKIIRSDLSTTICTILLVILIPFLIILETLAELIILFEQNPILRRIIDLFSLPVGLVTMIIFRIGLFLNCWY
ncbi:MAG: hypothetical protein JXA75_01390 [Candidatus Thermoplasmatota archaeon]|nr:hypothetical protein [Candidatus Thermoplasmatota archaeon]